MKNTKPAVTLFEALVCVAVAAIVMAVPVSRAGSLASFQKSQAECIAFNKDCEKADRLAHELKINWRSVK